MPCYSHKQVQEMARSVGFPDVLVTTKWGKLPLLVVMSAIATQESNRCDEPTGTIARGERSIGVFQINSTVHKKYTVAQLRDFRTNAKEALRIYNSQGLRAWGAYVDNKGQKYLAAAKAAYQGKADSSVILPASLAVKDKTTTEDSSKYIVIGAGLAAGLLLFTVLRK